MLFKAGERVLVRGSPLRGGVDRRAGVPPRVGVRATSAGAVRALLGRYGATYTERRTGATATFLVANPGGLTGDDHPFAAALAGDLAAVGVRVLALKAP